MNRIRVLIADDHPLYRAGLRILLSGQPDIDLAGEAETGEQAVEVAASTGPDIVVMDITMPGIGGIEATRQILASQPNVAILMLTMLDDGPSVLAAIRAGARGYLVKGAGGEEALSAIRAVAHGEIVISAAVAAEVLSRLGPAQASPLAASPAASAFPELTERERDILQLIAEGYTNTAIASRLHLGHKTVRNYVSVIFRKLQVTGRVDAVIRARDAGLG
jgi:DNA-binding NarL/FixJ family response regulator